MAQVRDLLADVKKIDAIESSVTQLQTDVTNFDALPSQVNQTGKYLTTNGADASWATITQPTLVSQLTNDSGYQTLAQVSAAVASLVDSAPGTLNTLNELAAALNDDPNFATSITNMVAGKANLSGGTFTGNVTVNGLFEVKDPGNYYNGHMRVGAVGQGFPYVNIGMDENDTDNPGMLVGWYIKALGDIITNRIRLGGVYGQTGQIIAAPNTYEAQWTTIKTVNGTSILGAGDIIISAYADSKVQTYLTANNYVNTTTLNTALALKADVSTTYTKTQVDTSLALKANTSSLGTLATLNAVGTSTISDGAVTAAKLGGNALFLTQFNVRTSQHSLGGDSGWVDHLSMTFTTNRVCNCIFFYSSSASFESGPVQGFARLILDGSQIGYNSAVAKQSTANAAGAGTCMWDRQNVSAGSHTITVQLRNVSGGSTWITPYWSADSNTGNTIGVLYYGG